MTKMILILFLILNINICTGKESLLPGSDVSIKNSLKNSMILPVSKGIIYDVPLIATCMAVSDANLVNDKFTILQAEQKFKVIEILSGRMEKEFTLEYGVFLSKGERAILRNETLLFILMRDKRNGYNGLLKAFTDTDEKRKEIRGILFDFLVSKENNMRADKPAFKGMELYSWKSQKDNKWYFSLLPGTNRNKTYEEVIKPHDGTMNLEEIKVKISFLAKGESVFWFNNIGGVSEKFSYPPEDVVKDLVEFCEKLDIKICYNN